MKIYEGVDTYITSSREKLKTQLTEYFKEYLQLDEVEIKKSSALGYLLQIITILSSNQIMYSTMTHRESNLITAQIPESIYDLSAYIGYTPKMATPATVDGLVTINTENLNNLDITFEKGFIFNADNIKFTLPYKYVINITNNQPQIKMYTNMGKINIAFDYNANDKQLQFLINLLQYETIEHEYFVPADIKKYQFFKQSIPITTGSYLYEIEVFVDNELWTKYDNIFAMTSSTKGYIIRMGTNAVNIYFGNGLFGKQPTVGSEIKVIVKETVGENGNIIPGSLTKGETLKVSGTLELIIDYDITNPSPGYNGQNQETVDETRSNAIINIKALNRLVSDEDYKNISKIININSKEAVSILKRSDIKCNEIVLYNIMEFYKDEPVPAITHYKDISNNNIIPPHSTFTINQNGENVDYICLFELVPDLDTLECNYYYYSKNVDIELNVEQIDSDNTKFFINKLNVQGDFSNSEFEFRIYYQIDEGETLSDYNVKLIMELGDYNEQLNFDTQNSYTDDDNHTYIKSTIPFSKVIPAYLNGTILVKKNDELLSQYSCVISIKLDLHNYTKSQIQKINDTTYRILDIPLIKKSWYDSLDLDSSPINLQKPFEMRIIQNNITTVDNIDIRMVNTYISNKFVNTVGELSNILLTNPTYRCKKLVTNGNTNGLSEGDMVLINGGLSTDGIHTEWIPGTGNFANHTTEIAVYHTSGWTFILPTISESVFIEENNLRLFYDGNEWFVPKYTIPLQIKLIAYLQNFDITFSDYIKEQVFNYFKENLFGINRNIYRSEIVKLVQGLDNIVYCKLIEPRIDLLFNFKLDDLTQDELLNYVPQYVYTTLDNIEVIIQKSSI